MDKCRKIKAEVYENATGTTPLLNVMADELRDIYDSEHSFNKVHLLHKKNIKSFKRIWGEQSCCWQGEYRNWVWLHELPNTTLFVLTSNKGTSYEFARADGNASWDASIKETKEFLNMLLMELEAFGLLFE